jgi:hypothetical protein
MRAPDNDREITVESPKTAFILGALNQHEFEERAGRALRAVTRDELAALTADLPVEPPPAPPPGPASLVRTAGNQPSYAEQARRAAQPRREARPAPAPRPVITIEEALTSLDALPGLAVIKNQIRQAATTEAARRRRNAGLPPVSKPLRHFLFSGPGDGKRYVAQILARVYYSFGLIELPDITEGRLKNSEQAIKLVESALGGVLFIDQAASIAPGIIRTLAQQAETYRDHLILIVADPDPGTEHFLSSDPGVADLFVIQKFPEAPGPAFYR